MRQLLFLIAFAVLIWDIPSYAADPCSINIGAVPDSTSVGSVLRNPGSGASIQTFSVPVTITSSSPQQVEFSAQNGRFQALENSSFVVSYSAKASLLTSSSSFVSPGSNGNFVNLGTMPAASVSGTFVFQAVAVQNLQPGTFSENISLRVGGADGQVSSFEVLGSVPTDCSVTLGGIPDAGQIGEILKNPEGRSISVPVSFSCNTFQASVTLSAQNGYFKPENPMNSTQVDYQIRMSNGLTSSSSSLASASLANNNWMTLGYLSDTAVSANLLITPTTVSNLPADTYTETVFIRVNGP